MAEKKCLIIRYGAFGDMLIITPVLKRLKKDGYYVILNTSERGLDLLKGNPNIDEFIEYKSNSVPPHELEEFWDNMKKDIKPDKFINFSESIEKNISLHMSTPQYNYTKEERHPYTQMNFYEETYKWAGYDDYNSQYKIDQLPEIYLSDEEWLKIESYVNPNAFTVLIGLSGSGNNKVYPFTYEIVKELFKIPNVNIITVGDEKCKALEYLVTEHSFPDKSPEYDDQIKRIKFLSGELPMRLSIGLTKKANLVICPDTGLLHGSGCFDTPKIGLLGHTTKANVTKHFINDYSIEANEELCACAPCARLIYSSQVQCPTDTVSRAAWCMHYGIPSGKIIKVAKEIIKKYEEAKRKN